MEELSQFSDAPVRQRLSSGGTGCRPSPREAVGSNLSCQPPFFRYCLDGSSTGLIGHLSAVPEVPWKACVFNSLKERNVL